MDYCIIYCIQTIIIVQTSQNMLFNIPNPLISSTIAIFLTTLTKYWRMTFPFFGPKESPIHIYVIFNKRENCHFDSFIFLQVCPVISNYFHIPWQLLLGDYHKNEWICPINLKKCKSFLAIFLKNRDHISVMSKY